MKECIFSNKSCCFVLYQGLENFWLSNIFIMIFSSGSKEEKKYNTKSHTLIVHIRIIFSWTEKRTIISSCAIYIYASLLTSVFKTIHNTHVGSQDIFQKSQQRRFLRRIFCISVIFWSIKTPKTAAKEDKPVNLF